MKQNKVAQIVTISDDTTYEILSNLNLYPGKNDIKIKVTGTIT